MASKTVVSATYEYPDGTKETRNIGHVSPESTNENLLTMVNKFASLQDEGVKALVSAKRTDTVELM